MRIMDGLRAVLSFLTIFPVGRGPIEEMGKYAFFFPLVGGVIGLISGSIALALFGALDPYLAGWLTLFTLLIITGLNHLDGIFDLGDGLMVRGSKERKLEVLHDQHHGVGGYFFLFSVLVITAFLISQLHHSIFVALITAETYGKLSMVVVGGIGKPHSSGLGRIFISRLKEHLSLNLILGVSLSLVIGIILNPLFVVALTITVVFVFSLLWTGYLEKSFGCITGDMLGSASELTRMLVLFVFYFLSRGGA